MTGIPTADIFKPHVGKAISLADGPALTLVAVNEFERSFALLLRGAPTPVVPEGMHRIALEGGTQFELYLIPVHTPSRDHQDYQIVFN